MTATGSSRRAAMDQTIPSGTFLPANSDISVEYRGMHRDARVFGADPDEFRWDRFVHNLDLAKDAAYKPYGGGSSQCPGKMLAATEVLMVVGMLVTYYDFDTSVSGNKIPDVDTKTPPTGVVPCVAEQDLNVRVMLRKE